MCKLLTINNVQRSILFHVLRQHLNNVSYLENQTEELENQRLPYHSAMEYTTDTDVGTMSDVIPVTGNRSGLYPEEIDALNNETASLASSAQSQQGSTLPVVEVAHSSSAPPVVRQQPTRAAKTRQYPNADETQSEVSTASDLESVVTQLSAFDTDISDTSSIAYTAPNRKYLL